MQAFIYEGRTFTPVKTLKGKDAEFEHISKRIRDIGITPNNWSYDDFYKVAKANGAGEIDLFEMKGHTVIPALNYLFEYGSNNTKLNERQSNTELTDKELHEMIFEDILEGLFHIDNRPYDCYVYANDKNRTLIVKNLTERQLQQLKNIRPDILELDPKKARCINGYSINDLEALKHFQFVKHQINKSARKEVYPVYF